MPRIEFHPSDFNQTHLILRQGLNILGQKHNQITCAWAHSPLTHTVYHSQQVLTNTDNQTVKHVIHLYSSTSILRSNQCCPQQLVRNGPGTSWFPHESCWRRHRCKDQLPWSSGKIQYLLLKLLTVKELATQKDCWQSEKTVVHIVFQFVRVFMQFHFLQQELCAMQLQGCMFAKVHQKRSYNKAPPL